MLSVCFVGAIQTYNGEIIGHVYRIFGATVIYFREEDGESHSTPTIAFQNLIFLNNHHCGYPEGFIHGSFKILDFSARYGHYTCTVHRY